MELFLPATSQIDQAPVDPLNHRIFRDTLGISLWTPVQRSNQSSWSYMMIDVVKLIDTDVHTWCRGLRDKLNFSYTSLVSSTIFSIALKPFLDIVTSPTGANLWVMQVRRFMIPKWPRSNLSSWSFGPFLVLIGCRYLDSLASSLARWFNDSFGRFKVRRDWGQMPVAGYPMWVLWPLFKLFKYYFWILSRMPKFIATAWFVPQKLAFGGLYWMLTFAPTVLRLRAEFMAFDALQWKVGKCGAGARLADPGPRNPVGIWVLLSACCSYDSYCIHTVHFLMLILVASRQQPAPEVLALAFGIGASNYAESNLK